MLEAALEKNGPVLYLVGKFECRPTHTKIIGILSAVSWIK